MAVCYYTAGTAFIKGCEYEYEVDECEPDREPCIINITEDEMAFELEGEYRWDAVRYGNASIDGYDSGTAYAIIKPSGNVGVSFMKKFGKWEAYIYSGGKKIKIGYYSNIDDAIKARKSASEEYGFHKNHGEKK